MNLQGISSPKTSPKLSLTPSVFRKALLAWYEKSGRHDLPWRGTSKVAWSPYPILVSELMLQQTTVATVIPFFHRFMKEFPTAQSLAKAPLERVLELWSGLGYYARARNLHVAAKKIVEEFGGRMPRESEAVRSLPGVGRYTAGAILSFAFDKPEPVVDGNVIRVLSRVYGVRDDVKDPKTVEKLWQFAWKLVPPGGARHFNSALMDLGALVCRPSAPDCLLCPFFKTCWACRHGEQENLPRSAADRPKKEVHVTVGLLEQDGRWAMTRRPEDGLYGGLWEFPGDESNQPRNVKEASAVLSRRLGFAVTAKEILGEVRHSLSHRDMYLRPWLCGTDENRRFLAIPEGGWFPIEEIDGMAVSTLTRRVLALLKGRRRPAAVGGKPA